MCSYTKACYCLQGGSCQFVLDMTNYSSSVDGGHRRHPTWNRVPSVRHHLRSFDWLLYLDSDIAVASTAIDLNDFVGQVVDQRTRVFVCVCVCSRACM